MLKRKLKERSSRKLKVKLLRKRMTVHQASKNKSLKSQLSMKQKRIWKIAGIRRIMRTKSLALLQAKIMMLI